MFGASVYKNAHRDLIYLNSFSQTIAKELHILTGNIHLISAYNDLVRLSV